MVLLLKIFGSKDWLQSKSYVGSATNFMISRSKSFDNQSFLFQKLIGNGVYGKVYLARNLSTQETFAVKVIERETGTKNIVELEILLNISHPFIVSCRASFKRKSQSILIMEYVGGGELYYHMKRRGSIPLKEAKIYVAELALAIDFLHQRGIVYRDLKPENIMMGLDGHLKLGDFGLAVKSSICFSVVGTPDYIAPELLQKKKCGKEVDWWALGVLFFEMLFRRTPFFAPKVERMYDKIVNKPAVVPDCAGNVHVATFINGLLEKDPAYRFGFEDIVKHPLMSDVNFDDVLHKRVPMDYIPERFDPEDPLYKKIKSENCVFAHGVSYDSQQAGMNGEEVDICQLNRIYG